MSAGPGVAIVGCGLIGQKRAAALGPARLVACADTTAARARALADRFGGRAETSWEAAVAASDVEIVIVATTNDALTPVAAAALGAGKHVLVEKPAARTVDELARLEAAAARAPDCLVRVGFNHRHHPAFRQARRLLDEGVAGPLMFVRGRYGHGGRPGYEQEWRADPRIAGGGELIDQGVHLIDLARWVLGDLRLVSGRAQTYFWPMQVEDNAFLHLETAARQTAWLHVSCTEWKNLFSMEIYGRHAKLQVDGLGGSYGVERLTLYRMLPEMGPPETISWEYPRGDDSWSVEFAEFVEDIRLGRSPAAGLGDARAALEIVASVYRESGRDYRA